VKLISAAIKNFKLLDDVRFDFSTDPNRPLTVIRAENGSGKTSLLYALLWGLFGEEGLDKEARVLRRTSAAAPSGVPVEVEVTIVFEHSDPVGGVSKYRLTRMQQETPKDGTDNVERGAQHVTLVELTPSGEETRHSEILQNLFPQRLKDIFFTNGEEVQTFIAGGTAADTQSLVHESIRQLLGLDDLEKLSNDLKAIVTKYQREAAKNAGEDVAKAQQKYEETQKFATDLSADLQILDSSMAEMSRQDAQWEKQLAEYQGNGNLTDLTRRRAVLKLDLEGLERQRSAAISRLRLLMTSEDMTWSLIEPTLEKGMGVLRDLYDKNVIPGVSLAVLRDRLSLGVCVCGESLDHNDPSCSDRRTYVEQLIQQQQQASEHSQKLTQTYHVAGASESAFKGRQGSTEDVANQRTSIFGEFAEITASTQAKNADLVSVETAIDGIDEQHVHALRTELSKVKAKFLEAHEKRGSLNTRIELAKKALAEAKAAYDLVEGKANKHDSASYLLSVAQDMQALLSGTVESLRTDYVHQVAAKTSQMFLDAVGADPSDMGAVFKNVRIDEDFKIVVESQDGRKLNPSFELNGASQRVLTLSFIWALTEISGAEAPRIIDTPLGMISGTVKKRLVDAITAPANADGPNFQVILLLTRSEIRDIEPLLDTRAGAYTTMSCNKDADDLVYRWGADHPLVKSCSCNHRQSCKICARKTDPDYNVVFKQEGFN
jgi:DNA sulfur modification protein DndD